jgi:multidrug efflux pump
MIDLLYRERPLLMLVILLIVVGGVISYATLPRLEDPELSQRLAFVFTQYPGADAEQVETLVTDRIEEALIDEIDELLKVESTSRAGMSTITVELEEEVRNVDEVWGRVRHELRDVQDELPSAATTPALVDLEMRGHAMIVGLTWDQASQPSYAILVRIADDLEDVLRAIPGTASVDVYGLPKEEITIELDPAKISSMGLAAEDVARSVHLTDSKVPSGLLRSEDAGTLVIEIEGELNSLDHIRRTPLRSGNLGQFVTVGDIATVKKGIREPASELAYVDNRPAVTVGVFLDEGIRGDQWAEQARKVMDGFQKQLPQGISSHLIFDQSKYTNERLSDLGRNLMLGAMAVMFVVFVMMGWRSALIVGTALPLTAMMVLSGMWVVGLSINQFSVAGLIIALGLLIDNAIVFVDEMRQRLREASSASEAIRQSVGHLAMPLIGSTLTTILAFMPIALMPGNRGEFAGGLAYGVMLALVSSLLLSMTLIPAFAAMLIRPGTESETASVARPRRWWQEGLSIPTVTEQYRGLLGTLFRRPLLSMALATVLPVAGFISATQLTEQFFPPSGRDMFHIEVELPKHASAAQTRVITGKISERLSTRERVKNVHWFHGENAPSFYYNLIRNQDEATYYAQAIVQLDSADHVFELINSVQVELDEAFPEARILARQLEQGPPFAAPVELRIFGPDLDRLEELGDDVRRILSDIPEVVHTNSQLGEGVPKLVFQVDEEKSRLAGFDKTYLANQINQALEGSVGGSLVEESEELPVRVRVGGNHRSDLATISGMNLIPHRQGQAEHIPLSALGKVELVADRSAITRYNGRRVNTVQAFITAGELPGKILADFRRRLEREEFLLPDGYSLEYGGETEERAKMMGMMLAPVPLLATLMLASLVLSFRSFKMSAIVVGVALLSLGLGFGSLWLFGFPFGFMAIMGATGLIGIAINDSIVVLAAIREDSSARDGEPGAVSEVVVRSSRHVLSTTITSIAGFLPLILSGGGFWPPLAIVIAGGVAGGTILAFVFAPSFYILIAGRRPEPTNTVVAQTALANRFSVSSEHSLQTGST